LTMPMLPANPRSSGSMKSSGSRWITLSSSS
jgi:hypothetical protein